MESIWFASCPIERREPLNRNLRTDVAVIGAGITGILTAYKLQKTGKEVVLLEANRIASGQTGKTTAKITSQHGLLYHRLIQDGGEEKARQYAQANENAIAAYRSLVREEQIDCDFETTDAYVYSQNAESLKKEALAAKKLGIAAAFVQPARFPIDTAGAVRFQNQAQFHPIKLIAALSSKLTIYENTLVRSVDGNQIETNRGIVRAGKIIFACHYPFVNFPGMYFARMHQERSYVLALENADAPDGMWIGAEKPAYSMRRWQNILLFGGESHRTGKNRQGGRYRALSEKAQMLFPGSHVVGAWSAQDCITPDHIPYIGSYSPYRPDWLVATGFQKWGMSTAMVAAEILCDQLCSKENPYADLFRPGRFSAQNISGIASEGAQAVRGLGKRFFQIPQETAKTIPEGHGGIVLEHGEKTGVQKDENGKTTFVSPRCPHMGCQLEWNPDEQSWDCPCHGSRFDRQGNLLEGPAQTGISHS